MSRQVPVTAVILAGTRGDGDPLAAYAGVTHKALIEIDGRTMLDRVLSAVAPVAAVKRVVVAIERPELVSAVRLCGKPVLTLPPAAGPTATVGRALESYGVPLLVTTADHALLASQWVTEFLSAAPAQADAVLALAPRAAVQAVAPDTQRTYLRFADGEYSGCNLFLLRTPAAAGVLRFWQALEADRKRPVRMLRRLGLGYAVRYRLGWLTLQQALGRLSTLTGAKIAAVALSDGRAAIDVDKPADLDLVRRLLANQARG